MVVLFAVLAAVFFAGKGSFLIAGYNTASKAEQAKYDEKKLNRVMGAGMSMIALLLIPGAVYEDALPVVWVWVMGIGMLLVVAGILILSNTICKAKEPQAVAETPEDQRRHKRGLIISVAASAVICLIVLFVLLTGNIAAEIDGQLLRINASYWMDGQIDLSEVTAVDYTEDFSVGKRTNGWGSIRIQAGNFRNSELGAYQLYAYTECHAYIVLDTPDGAVVLNAENEAETQKLYEEISGLFK